SSAKLRVLGFRGLGSAVGGTSLAAIRCPRGQRSAKGVSAQRPDQVLRHPLSFQGAGTMEFATRTIHAGQPSEPETGALIAPIFQTSTYEQESPGCHRGFDYSRTNNPTRARLEAVLADLEGVRHAAVFASGLAAENAALQAHLRPGDEIVIPQDVYGGT